MRSRSYSLTIALAVAVLVGCAGDPNLEGAKLNLRNNEYDAAIENLDAALETNPDNVEALTLRAEVRRQQAERGAPGSRFVDADGRCRDTATGQFATQSSCSNSAAAIKAAYLQDMIADVRRAQTLAPDDPAVEQASLGAWALAVNSGNDALRDAESDPSDAVALFETAVDVQPDSMQGYFGLGLAHLRAGNSSEAVAPLRRAVEIAPNDATSAVYLGRALLLSDQGSEAVTVLEEAAARFPDDPDIQTSLLNAYAQSGDTDRAMEQYERAVQGAGADDPVVRYNYGALLLNAGRYDEAIEQLEEATRLNPENADAFYNLGASYQNKAAALNDQANETDDNAEAERLIAERDQNLEASLPHLMRARELAAAQGDEGSVCLALFRVYTQLGRVDDAESVSECAGVSMN